MFKNFHKSKKSHLFDMKLWFHPLFHHQVTTDTLNIQMWIQLFKGSDQSGTVNITRYLTGNYNECRF